MWGLRPIPAPSVERGVGSWGKLSRCVLYLSTLALLVIVVASFDRRWSWISNEKLPKQSTEQAYIVRLEYGRLAAGSYPSDVAFRGLVPQDWCVGVPTRTQRKERADINLAHQLDGNWNSPPVFRRMNLGRSVLTYVEFPLVYALLPLLTASVLIATRDARHYVRKKHLGCKRCGYPIEGLPSTICPECGHTNNAGSS